MATKLMRADLRPLYEAATGDPHPGLLLQRGLAEHDDDPDIKKKHVERICASTAGDFYRRAYDRWTRATADAARFRSVNLKLRTRLFIGLTGGGVLETGCAISRAHGTPYIPGSSVKGVVAAHALERLDETGDAFRELFGARPTAERPDALSGLIAFHDAWWVPDSAEPPLIKRPLVKEVVTTHHPDYYSKEGAVPATDFDSPVPNAQVAVQGAFLFVIGGPDEWLDFAERMLVSALTASGAGAKTRAGYGLFADPEASGSEDSGTASSLGRKWIDDKLAELTAKPGVQADQALRGKALAEAWASMDDPSLQQAVFSEIQSRWQKRGWWDDPQGRRGRPRRSTPPTRRAGMQPHEPGERHADGPRGQARMTQPSGRTLVLTVGTGDLDRLEETLFTPLRKSIATEAWTRVVLLSSSVTEDFARTLRHRLDGATVEVSALPVGDENDADAAYAHFDRVLATVLRDVAPEDVVVDFTRGTKAMSASLVLAATRRAIPRLRYVTGRRDRRGMVVPGSEQVRGIRTTTVDGHRRLDLARALFARGDFAAVAHVLPTPDGPLAPLYPNDFVDTARAVRSAARFYTAWDRLDHAAAATVEVAAPPSDDWRRFWPTPDAHAWVAALAREPERIDHRAMAARLRRLAVDLLANGERRVRQGQNEDALVRAYRLLELIGQARLFDHGLDSANLDPDREAVVAVQRESERKKRKPFSEGPGGKLLASRFQVGRLLRHCGDRLAKSLLRFDDETLLKPTLRNNSVLVHGFAARAPDDPTSLRRLFRDLEKLAREDCGDAVPEVADWLRIARSPAFDAT